MRKITSMQAAPFSAKIFFDCQYGEYRVRFYRAGELMPECDAFETDEESARGTMELALRLMVREAIAAEAEADDARTDSETEQLNIRLAREFNWPDLSQPLYILSEAEQAREDMIYENVRPYLVRRRAVYKDAMGGIVSIIERDYPQDMPDRDCRDDLLTFAPFEWMSVEVETVPIIGRPSDSHFSYTDDGDIL